MLEKLYNVKSMALKAMGEMDQQTIEGFLQTGKNDEFSLNLGIEGLSKILLTHSVDHVSQTYEGGHFGIDYLYLDSIPELISYLREF